MNILIEVIMALLLCVFAIIICVLNSHKQEIWDYITFDKEEKCE